MDIITMGELERLIGGSPGWCVSLFMPTHRAGRDTEQDPIRFKNLLRKAEQQLVDGGLRTPEVRGILDPAEKLLDDPFFWRHQSDGLALFASSEMIRTYRLPVSFEELVVVSDRFQIKPLLPLYAHDGHFYILALSQNEVRLLEGTRHSVDEITAESTIPSLAEALRFDSLEKQLQFHTRTASVETGDRAAVFHGHDPSDEDKERILQWFYKVDSALSSVLKGQEAPMILAGVEYLFPLYKEANSYRYLVDEGIRGNPEELKPEELHDQAWPIAQRVFMKAQQKAVAQYRELAGTGRTTIDVQEAVSAAYQGRVDVLFVTIGLQVWGHFDLETNTVQIHAEHKMGDQDLLDLAAVQTMLHGGTVYAVEQDQVPDHGLLATTFRY